MSVDFSFRKVPSIRVIYVAWKGPWNEGRIRKQFESVQRWAKEQKVRTGRWIFREPGEGRWEAAVEVKGRVRTKAPLRSKTLRASRVASVVFDPEVVSPRVVYHGLNDWLRWRKKDKEVRSVGSTREIYTGNPWTDKRAWSRTEVQFLVKP